MLKKLFYLTVVLVCSSVIVMAQSKYEVINKAPLKMDNNTETENLLISNSTNKSAMGLPGWVTVDSMANSYGPSSPTLNPFYYDPYSGAMALIHRGGGSVVATGSGKLYYNFSTDFGLTWERVPTALNSAAATQLGRYPSAAISNAAKAADINETIFAAAWPELNPSAFGFLGYGADQPVGGNSPVAGIDQGPPNYSSNVPVFVNNETGSIFWVSDNQTDASLRLFRTQDYVTIDIIDPPTWSSTTFQDNGNIALGGFEKNGVLYYAVIGSFVPPDTNNPIISGWFPGVSKSTDDGATWSEWDVIDFRLIPELQGYVRLFDNIKEDTYIAYCGDMVVDADGYPHLVVSVTDTTGGGDGNLGSNAFIELYQTASGWNAKMIDNDLDSYIYTKWHNADNNPGIGQMGENGMISISQDGELLVAAWINVNKSAAIDSLCAIFYSTRQIDADNWSTPVKLTENNNMNFNAHHITPIMRKVDETTYQSFHMTWYAVDMLDSAVIVTTTPNEIYVTSLTHTITGVNDNNEVVSSFELGQNYPNPFNPVTTIKYSVPSTGNVVLKVYDVLGREVSTLINRVQEAGQHSISFDASALSSGMYIYTITSGNFTASKKMMLMK